MQRNIDGYQLKIGVKKISPMIWRRVQVRSDTSLVALHSYLQILMKWEDIYLHQFNIRGVMYSGNEKKRLSDFEFYINERFTYEYNFFGDFLYN